MNAFVNASHEKYLKYFIVSFGTILIAAVVLVYPGFDVSGFYLYEALNFVYGKVFTGLDAYQTKRTFEQSPSGLFLFLYIWLPSTLYISFRMAWERSKFDYSEDQIYKMANWKIRIGCLFLLVGFYWMLGADAGHPNLCNADCSNLNELFFMLIFPGAWIAVMIVLFATFTTFFIRNMVKRSK